MKISLRCSYRNKPSGFQNARFVCENGEYLLQDTSFTGATAGIFTRQCGPMYFCSLLSGGEGKLVLIVCGLGRRNTVESYTHWTCGDDTKIVNIIFEEEEAEDRAKILSLAYVFCRNYYKAGNVVLENLIPAPDTPPLEYGFDYNGLINGLDGLIEDGAFSAAEVASAQDKLYLYFTPCVLSEDKAQQVITYFKDFNLAVNKGNLLSVSCTPEKFLQALNSEEGGLKGLFNKFKNWFNQ